MALKRHDLPPGLAHAFLFSLTLGVASTQEIHDAWAARPAGEVPRDPRGIKGVSPFWEAVKAADAAFVARDFDTAILGYQEALKVEPRQALGHYRLGEAQRAKGQLAEAQAAFEAGLRYVDEPVLKAKLLFVLGDLAERNVDLEKAKLYYEQYGAHVKNQKPGKGVKYHPGSTVERLKRITEREQALLDGAAVKERVKKREAELTPKAGK